MDRAQIEPGSDWRQRIERGIQAAKALIFVITPESLASQECRRELDIALQLHKLVVPVLRREVDRSQLPETLSRHNWALFRDGDDQAAALAQLVQALDADLDWRDAHTRLGVRTAEWAGAKRDRSYLLRGSDLRAAEDWASQATAHPRTPPTPLQLAFIQASRKAADRAARTWRLALSAGLVISLALGGLALTKEIQATHEARVAQSNALAADATVDLSSDPQQSVSLALRSTQLEDSSSSEQALRLALADDRARVAISSPAGANAVAAWDPEGEEVALSTPSSVELWSAADGRLLQSLTVPSRYRVTQLLFDPAGSYLAAISSEGYVSVWSTPPGGRAIAVATGPLNGAIRQVGGPPQQYGLVAGIWDQWLGPHTGSRWWPGGREQLDIFGSPMTNVVEFNPGPGQPGVRDLFGADLKAGATVDEVAPSPNGAEVFVIAGFLNEGTDQVIDFADDKQWRIVLPTDDNGDPGPACWYPDGSVLVTSSTVDSGWPVDSWDPANGRLVTSMQPPGPPTTAVTCSAGEGNDWVAVGDALGDLLLRLPGGSVVPLFGDSQSITGIASSPDGRFLATSSADGTARIWDARTGHLLATLAGDGAPLDEVQFDGDGGLALTVDSDGMLRIWDTEVGAAVTQLSSASDDAGGAGALPSGWPAAYPLGFIDGGRSVYGLSASHSTAVALGPVELVTWAATTGQLQDRYPLPDLTPSTVPCTGYLVQMLGSAFLGATKCRVPPPPSLAVAIPLPHATPEGPFDHAVTIAVAVSADGRYGAYGGRSAGAPVVRVVDLATRATVTLPVASPVSGLSFAASDELVVMTSRAVYLWKPFGQARPVVFHQPSPPTDAELGQDGTRLATANTGGTVAVWAVGTGRLVATFRTPAGTALAYFAAGPLRVALNADGTVVAEGDTEGRVTFWDVRTHARLAQHLLEPEWPVTELQSAAGGNRLLAVNFPQSGTDANAPAAAGVFDANTGAELATYTSPSPASAPVNPGAALSPDGGFLLAGADGVAPAPPGGIEDVYQVASGALVAGLAGVTASVPQAYSASPADPWSPAGNEVLIGNSLYACDGCAPLSVLQHEAVNRAAWSRPLSAADDRPPPGSPYS